MTNRILYQLRGLTPQEMDDEENEADKRRYRCEKCKAPESVKRECEISLDVCVGVN